MLYITKNISSSELYYSKLIHQPKINIMATQTVKILKVLM